jgi:DNA polymerase-1
MPVRQRNFGFESDEPNEPTKVTSATLTGPVTNVCEPTSAPAEPVSLADKTVYVVDAHSLIYQVFHAIPEMTSPTGQPVAAIYGFVRDILDILEKKKPDYLFCAFDAPGGETFRHEIFQSYKHSRQEMPVDLRPQIGNIQRMLAAMGVPTLVCPNYEADDILATIAHQTESMGGKCVVVTGDKDCRQLITERTNVYNIRKDEMFDTAALQTEWGISPQQVVDFQSLVGDSVDDIPGVPLIGPKIAGELLRQYGNLENLFEHIKDVAGTKRRENLQNYREQALMSRQLVRLDRNSPIQIDWESGRVGGINRAEVLALCSEFGFRRLSERITGMSVAEAPSAWQSQYQTVESAPQLEELVRTMQSQSRIAIAIESSSTSPRWAELIGIAFAWQEGSAYYVPVRALAGDLHIPPADVVATLKPLLENPAVEKIGHNVKHLLIVLRSLGIHAQAVNFDTMVADYLLEPGERIHNVEDLAKRYLNFKTIKLDELAGSGKQRKLLSEIPVQAVSPYVGQSADIPWRLEKTLHAQLDEQDLVPLYRELEMPLIEVLAEMEFNGIRVDTARLRELGQRYGERISSLEAEIYELSSGPFNIESPKQLSKLLFEQLQLPVLKRTKTGPSTDVEVLTDLAKIHPLPAKVIEYRQFAKLKSTYVDALPELVHPQTGRVHTSFKQDVAATGRLSSTDPNLQNIPIRTVEGREIRSAFLAGEQDWQLLAADYSQIELRVLAHFSGDEALRSAFQEDRDIHTQVAAEVYGVSLDEVTREMRRSAKAVNFGVIYGQTPFGLAKALDIEKDVAARFIEKYFCRYSGVAEFMKKTLYECRRQGFVSTIFGRRRPVQGVRDPAIHGNSYQRTLPERIAINTVIQGSAADIIKRAMIQVHHRLQQEKLPARLLLQIHDELVLEFAPGAEDAVRRLVVDEMSSAAKLSVPLKVDVKIGATWAECE